MQVPIYIFIFLILTTLFIFSVNRWHRPRYGELKFDNSISTPISSREICVVCWNIGYAALGSRAEFILEGGKSWRVFNKAEIRKAAQSIAYDLQLLAPDTALIQEAAKTSFFTRNINILDIITSTLKNYTYIFRPDVYTVFVPKPLKIHHGLVTYTKNAVTRAIAHGLQQETSYHYGFQRKRYLFLTIQQPIYNSVNNWTIINIHLSAFDEGASLRKQQLKTVFDFAKLEYQKGNFVIIGGDWNMKISPTVFPCTSLPKNQFWVKDFPIEDLPDGWEFAIDETVPTTRTQERPYIKGESFTAIIDGFVMSPNVSLLQVKCIDKDFTHTDHHPVWARFEANL